MSENARALSSLLPLTKLRPPGTQDTIVRVARVAQVRQLTLSHRLTLVAAPAGSGKTTLVADFVQQADDLNVRWLSLDAGDNDLQPFLLALVLATLPDIEADLFQMLSQGQIAGRQVAALLINRLDAIPAPPVILVLDDLHVLTSSAIHDFLDYFIERLPAHVHVLATTRYDPPLALARWRGRGELAEMRLDALRFDRAEADELLNRQLGLDIPASLIDLMIERTEGWIAGLRLLALSLEKINIDQRSRYIAELAQKDRYVFDLLAEEVLQQQRADIRRFLLDTAILDELTLPLCAAVTQQADAAAILHDLHGNNLFLVAVGDGTYRYHALFRDFLQEQLKRQGADHIRALHYRAAQAHTNPLARLDHLISAEAWTEALDLFGVIVKERFVGIYTNLYGVQLERIIDRIPAELRQTDPWLLFVQGGMLIDQGYYSDSVVPLQRALAGLRDRGDEHGQLLAETLLLVPAVEQPDSGASIENMFELLQRYEEFVTPVMRAVMLQGAVWNSVWNYRHEEFERYLPLWIDSLISLDDASGYYTFAQAIGPQLIFSRRGAEPLARILPYLENHASAGYTVARMGVCNIRALLSLARGEIAEAQANARQSETIIRNYGSFAWADALVDVVLLAGMFIDADYAALARYHQARLPEILQQDTARKMAPEMLYIYGRSLLAEGDFAAAERVADDIHTYAFFKEYDGLELALRGHIARLQGDFTTAEALLRSAVAVRAEVRRYFPTHAPLGLALLYWQMGDERQAVATLRAGLAPLAAWGYPGIVLLEGRELEPLLHAAAAAGIEADFVGACLDAFGAPRAPHAVAIPGTGEMLTPREVEILRLIVAGASNREIAAALVISENTVKSHITRILGKLGAKSRTEAAARVHALALSL